MRWLLILSLFIVSLHAAKEKGFYQDAGLDAELREYQNNIDSAFDILNRKVTYGLYNTSARFGQTSAAN